MKVWQLRAYNELTNFTSPLRALKYMTNDERIY